MPVRALRAIAGAGLVATALTVASSSGAVDFRESERLRATGVFPDAVFLTGREVVSEARTADDMFIGGGQVHAARAAADHLFAAGGAVRFTEVQARDVIALGGDVAFESGRTEDDVVAAGGRLQVRPGFQVGGSAILTGGQVEVQSPIGGDLVASGGEVTVDAPVRGDVKLSGDRLVIGPSARIGGDLAYTGRLEVSPEAVITGRRIERPMQATGSPERFVAAAAAAAAGFVLVLTLGGALLVLVVVGAFPRLMNEARERIRSRPLPTFGIGFLLMVGGPVLIGLLFASVVGIPLALLVLALYVAAAPLAVAATVYLLGMEARRRIRGPNAAEPASAWARFGWSALATLALAIVGMLPFIGGLAWLLAYVAGLGAIAVEGRRALAGAAARSTAAPPKLTAAHVHPAE